MDFNPSHNWSAQLCILFADIAGSTRLYEMLGDQEASRVVKLCLDEMKAATVASQGLVIDTIGDEILATFTTPEQATLAAELMMRRVERLPLVAGKAINLRIGFHFGPVLWEGGQLFGDTVNTAARIVSLAEARQIFASKVAVNLLPPALRNATRDIAAFSLKGKREEMDVCEILWQGERSQLTVQLKKPEDLAAKQQRLLLSVDTTGQRYTLEADMEQQLTLGRGSENHIVIDNLRISRRHARIEMKRNKYVLTDSSTNGTWVIFDGKSEVVLRHEELALHGRGIITLGHPYDHADKIGTLAFVVA